MPASPAEVQTAVARSVIQGKEALNVPKDAGTARPTQEQLLARQIQQSLQEQGPRTFAETYTSKPDVIPEDQRLAGLDRIGADRSRDAKGEKNRQGDANNPATEKGRYAAANKHTELLNKFLNDEKSLTNDERQVLRTSLALKIKDWPAGKNFYNTLTQAEQDRYLDRMLADPRYVGLLKGIYEGRIDSSKLITVDNIPELARAKEETSVALGNKETELTLIQGEVNRVNKQLEAYNDRSLAGKGGQLATAERGYQNTQATDKRLTADIQVIDSDIDLKKQQLLAAEGSKDPNKVERVQQLDTQLKALQKQKTNTQKAADLNREQMNRHKAVIDEKDALDKQQKELQDKELKANTEIKDLKLKSEKAAEDLYQAENTRTRQENDYVKGLLTIQDEASQKLIAEMAAEQEKFANEALDKQIAEAKTEGDKKFLQELKERYVTRRTGKTLGIFGKEKIIFGKDMEKMNDDFTLLMLKEGKTMVNGKYETVSGEELFLRGVLKDAKVGDDEMNRILGDENLRNQALMHVIREKAQSGTMTENNKAFIANRYPELVKQAFEDNPAVEEALAMLKSKNILGAETHNLHDAMTKRLAKGATKGLLGLLFAILIGIPAAAIAAGFQAVTTSEMK